MAVKRFLCGAVYVYTLVGLSVSRITLKIFVKTLYEVDPRTRNKQLDWLDVKKKQDNLRQKLPR